MNAHFGHLNVEMLGGVVLNNFVGGLNPHAVDHDIKLGGRIVWMPTICAENHIEHQKDAKPGEQFPSPTTTHLPLEPVPLFDKNGAILDSLKAILDMIAKHDLVLSAGHIHVSEIYPLFDEAKSRGVRRLIVNHPTYAIDATLEDLRRLGEMGAYLEHSLCMWVGPMNKVYEPETLKEYILAASVDRTILGSDLGLKGDVPPVEGFRQTIEMLIDLGFEELDIRKLTSLNARQLVGL